MNGAAQRFVSLLVALMIAAGGCRARTRTLIECLPHDRQASPWVLDGAAWKGSFAAAERALGEDAVFWRPHAPTSVWLARYVHERDPRRRVVLRAFAFASPEDAQAAYDFVRAKDARPFSAGDQACWTADGLLVRWGRMVWELFASEDSHEARPEQVVFLLSYLEQHIDPALPVDPQ
ncbi:MAG: hypothetical protein D6744_17245 [Planctomycetota bacterium]|nr:MAG: hypothetical protein D6744_17245 [Planctomycetota bacterium]